MHSTSAKEPTMKILTADIVTAFDHQTIGTKVMDPDTFWRALEAAIAGCTFPAAGQAIVALPVSAYEAVSAGVRRVEHLGQEDFVVRKHRGHWGLYARRPQLGDVPTAVTDLSCVVYTKAAYLADPDLTAPERERVLYADPEYVLVAVLASASVSRSPLPIWTLVHNIAGGNNAFIPESSKGPMKLVDHGKVVSADLALLAHFIAQAKASEEYWRDWAIVAD
jgi:hypothetical protein